MPASCRFAWQEFPWGPFLLRKRDEYVPIATEKGLVMSVHAGRNGVVLTDEALLGRAVGNLLDNAIKYTEQGTVRLVMHAHAGTGQELAGIMFLSEMEAPTAPSASQIAKSPQQRIPAQAFAQLHNDCPG